MFFFFFFFFNDTATTEIYTLSLHDALPISLFQLSPCSPNLLASVALTLPLPQEFFLFCRFPWDARRKGRFLGLCGPLCPCAWLVDSGFSLNRSEERRVGKECRCRWVSDM